MDVDVAGLRREWGRRVRERRLRLGLTQSAVGMRAGLSAQRINQVERARHGASDEARIRLAAALSMPGDPVRVEDLFPYPAEISRLAS